MTKQIGVIADIHSNFTAFKTAVKYMEAQGITEFFFLGDYVSDTTDTAETMDYIYKLMDRYIVNVSARRDGSSKFTEANRWANFYAGGLGWIIWCIYIGTRGVGGMEYWFFRLLFGTPGQA